jgi:hypothetical protein
MPFSCMPTITGVRTGQYTDDAGADFDTHDVFKDLEDVEK